ncbi:MAG TPA: aldehyde oxidase [Firmicutes bacterium]|nr:aldehyde oxidase [Bacillota bacterium]
MRNISEAIKRFDFDEKIEGRAQYAADLKDRQMLYVKTLRSEKARAKIMSIKYPPLSPGYFIVDYRDIPGENRLPLVFEDQPFLAVDRVNYIGEPILLVVGPVKKKILAIMQEIRVDYQELTPILNIAEARQRQEDFIFEGKSCFVEYEYEKGDITEVKKKAWRVVEDEFRTGYQEQAYLETQAIVAAVEDQRITVCGSIQCPYYIKEALRQALGWPEERIRVKQLPTGGGFGGKEEFPSLVAVHAALAALKAHKPVQLVYDRQEDISCSTKRHPAVIRLKSYLDDRQRITGREIEVMTDAGAYAGLSSVVLQRMIFSVGGVYNIENLKIRGQAYATNNVVSGAFRGFGGPQAFFAMEMHMENIARALHMEALALKRGYFLRKGDTSTTGGKLQSDIKLAEIVEKIDKISGYSRKRRDYDAADGGFRGIGCSVFFHGCGFTGSGEQEIIKPKVRLRKYRDNTVQICVSSSEIGQGCLTTLRKIVAQVLEIPVEQVQYDYPDSDICPDSGPTVASRTVMIVGKLLYDCARKVKARWQEGEFTVDQAYVYPGHLQWDNEHFRGNAYPEYSWGANVVEVAVDPLTYEVKVLGTWAVYDIGTPIDEKIVKGQIDGGMAQGLGYGCLEVLESHGGRLRQNNFTNYAIPTAVDFPATESGLIDNPYEYGPFGARGLGELSLVGAAPALAAAVQQAIGRRVRQIPLTPEYIMELMDDED